MDGSENGWDVIKPTEHVEIDFAPLFLGNIWYTAHCTKMGVDKKFHPSNLHT